MRASAEVSGAVESTTITRDDVRQLELHDECTASKAEISVDEFGWDGVYCFKLRLDLTTTAEVVGAETT
ncbi:unnamed protein product [Didymodactylos carnosus]|uniref:Uncharacterized protein n=1 Tax=Didymodactylos carnosus TaxID=1234261 RepID=A0A814VG71_9BILA|nr:unnamed protein product [Didymodactylos carnosus]CAF1531502.1 unnamed protein product [Didymodactylos carnosus]CAF3952848.1 unnamed protein product [Didymodactylos carnosus]CAF4318636.1 unnamed protein product [Didymodactylos carnosus]